MKTARFRAAMAAAAALLAACGGSDDDGAVIEDPSAVPASATSSSSAWVSFAKGLLMSDTSEPLSLGGVSSLPTSETEEPLLVKPG